MKTKEELNALKEEVEALNKKLAELTEDELKEVTGGFIPALPPSAEIDFHGTFDGNSKTVPLNVDSETGPQGYDCSGIVD